jgi:hypothetical protein
MIVKHKTKTNMKKIIYSITLGLFCGALMFVSSCKKDDKPCRGHSSVTKEEAVQNRIKDLIRRLPIGNVGDIAHRSGKSMIGHPIHSSTRDGWSFSQPEDGLNYSSTNSIAYSEDTHLFYVTPSAFGSNSSLGGTVVAGSTSLDINYAFCFAYEDGEDALGGDLFSASGATTNGLSGVIGISGDFEELQGADSTTAFSDIFHGLAFYFVYDGRPDGQYDVADWLDLDWGDSTTFDNKCFAFIFDFTGGKLYLSKDGHIDVSGGSMSFNGNYFEVSGFLNEDGEYDLEGDLTLTTVPGFGTMGCN